MSILYFATLENSPTYTPTVVTDFNIMELYHYLLQTQYAGRKPPRIMMHRQLAPQEEVSFLILCEAFGEFSYDKIIKDSSIAELKRLYSFILGVSISLNNQVYKLPSPNRHHHLIKQIREEGIQIPIPQTSQGFYTESKEFLTRDEARKLVIYTGQCKAPQHAHQLVSEDLW